MDSAKPKLLRKIGLLGIVALGVDNVIGGGINYISVQIQDKVLGIGNLLFLIFILGGAIAFFIAVSYSYLGSAMPKAGGEYVWVSRGWKGVMGFLSSFSFWIAQSAAAGAIAYFDPDFLATFFEQIGKNSIANWINTQSGTIIIGLSIIWLVWLIHISSVKSVEWTSIVFMFLMLFGGGVIIYYGLTTTPNEYAQALKQDGIDMNHFIAIGKQKVAQVKHVDYSKALFILFFSFIGFTSMSQASGETKNPKKTLAIAFPLVVVIITIYFTLYVLGIYHAVPWEYTLGQLEQGNVDMVNGPALIGYVMPKYMAAFVSLMVAFSLFNDLPPIYQTLTRLFFSWGTDGIFPKWACRVNKRGVPFVSVTLNAIIVSIFFLLTALFGWVSEITVASISAIFMYILVGITALVFKEHAPQLEKESAFKHSIFIFICGLITIIVPSWLFVEGILSQLHKKLYLQPFMQWSFIIIIGLIVYAMAYKKAKKNGKSLDEIMKQLPEN